MFADKTLKIHNPFFAADARRCTQINTDEIFNQEPFLGLNQRPKPFSFGFYSIRVYLRSSAAK